MQARVHVIASQDGEALLLESGHGKSKPALRGRRSSNGREAAATVRMIKFLHDARAKRREKKPKNDAPRQ